MSAGERSARSVGSVKLGIALALALVVVAVIALPVSAAHGPVATRWLGRFHVLALHVPVGALVVVLLAEAATFTRRWRRLGGLVVGFALPIFVVTGAAAIVLGLMLAHGGHYPQKLVAPHRNLTVIAVVLAVLAALRGPPRAGAPRTIHRALLLASALTMSVGAHFGGSITHGADYLTAPVDERRSHDEPTASDAPPPVASTSASAPIAAEPEAGAPSPPVSADAGATPDAAAPLASSSASVAASASSAPPRPKPTARQLAQAIVNRRCAPCHTTRSRGGLRLADVTHPTKNGVVVPGSPESSSLYTRLVLPLDDDDHMPPYDEAQPTKGEIATLRAFIAELKVPTP